MSLLKTYLEKIQNQIQIDGVLRNLNEFETPRETIDILKQLKWNKQKDWEDFDSIHKSKEYYVFLETSFDCTTNISIICSAANYVEFLYKEKRNYTSKEILLNALIEENNIKLSNGLDKLLGISEISGDSLNDEAFDYFYEKYCEDELSSKEIETKENWIQINQNQNTVTIKVVIGGTN